MQDGLPACIVEPVMPVGYWVMPEAMMWIEERVHLYIRRSDDRVGHEHVFVPGGAQLEDPGSAPTINGGSVEEADVGNRSHPNAGNNTYRHTIGVSPEAVRPDGATTTGPHGTRSTWLARHCLKCRRGLDMRTNGGIPNLRLANAPSTRPRNIGHTIDKGARILLARRLE